MFREKYLKDPTQDLSEALFMKILEVLLNF